MGAQVFLYPLRKVVYPAGLCVDLGVQAADASVDLGIKGVDPGTHLGIKGVDPGIQAANASVDLGVQTTDVGTHHRHDADEPGDHHPEDRPAKRCSHAKMLPGCLQPSEQVVKRVVRRERERPPTTWWRPNGRLRNLTASYGGPSRSVPSAGAGGSAGLNWRSWFSFSVGYPAPFAHSSRALAVVAYCKRAHRYRQ